MPLRQFYINVDLEIERRCRLTVFKVSLNRPTLPDKTRTCKHKRTRREQASTASADKRQGPHGISNQSQAALKSQDPTLGLGS